MKGQIEICFRAELEPGVGGGHRSFPAQFCGTKCSKEAAEDGCVALLSWPVPV